MTDEPFVPVSISPQLSTGHKKDTPVRPPFSCLVDSIKFLEQAHDRFAVSIHVSQPCLRRFFVMLAIHTPVLFDLEMFLKGIEQLIGRHHSTGEEISCNPIALV